MTGTRMRSSDSMERARFLIFTAVVARCGRTGTSSSRTRWNVRLA
jgi:hypothetical protein